MRHETLTLPAGIMGTQSQLTVYRFGQPNARPKVYLQAGLHADEWPAMLVFVELIKALNALEQQGKIFGEIVIVPIANPVGLRQFLGGFQLGRFDFDYSGNFNRGYPDLAALALPMLDREAVQRANPAQQVSILRAALQSALHAWQPQLEADHMRKALLQLAHDADYVLDCHCDAHACLHAFANQQHAQTATKLCTYIGAELLLLEESTGVMAFDEAVASPWWKLANALDLPHLARTCFSTTLEFRGERDVGVQTAQDCAGLLRFFHAIGVLDAPAPIPAHDVMVCSLNNVARVLAPQSALVEFHVRAGDTVTAGQKLCTLHQLEQLHHENAQSALLTPCAGKVYALGRHYVVKAGHVLVQIASHDYHGNGTLTF